MANWASLRTMGLLVIAGMLAGCSYWGWPFPGIVQNFEGLGTGRIADFIRNQSSSRGEATLQEEIAAFIARSLPEKRFSREDAESLGLQCAPAPSTDCAYSGEFWFRSVGPPPANPRLRKPLIENIQVRLSYLKPREFVVQVRERAMSED
jgi:hypothetical protein